jgi:hypothetical protein
MTLADLAESLLVHGPDDGSAWDRPWRAQLVTNLAGIARTLWTLNIGWAVVNGSFVETQPHPNDVDVYFPVSRRRWVRGEIARELNRRRRERVWTWDPDEAYESADRRVRKPRAPFWHKHPVDLWPYHEGGSADGVRTFAEFFRPSRTGEPKGAVKIMREGGAK